MHPAASGNRKRSHEFELPERIADMLQLRNAHKPAQLSEREFSEQATEANMSSITETIMSSALSKATRGLIPKWVAQAKTQSAEYSKRLTVLLVANTLAADNIAGNNSATFDTTHEATGISFASELCVRTEDDSLRSFLQQYLLHAASQHRWFSKAGPIGKIVPFLHASGTAEANVADVMHMATNKPLHSLLARWLAALPAPGLVQLLQSLFLKVQGLKKGAAVTAPIAVLQVCVRVRVSSLNRFSTNHLPLAAVQSCDGQSTAHCDVVPPAADSGVLQSAGAIPVAEHNHPRDLQPLQGG